MYAASCGRCDFSLCANVGEYRAVALRVAELTQAWLCWEYIQYYLLPQFPKVPVVMNGQETMHVNE